MNSKIPQQRVSAQIGNIGLAGVVTIGDISDIEPEGYVVDTEEDEL